MSTIESVPWKQLETVGPAAFGLGGLAILVDVVLQFVTSGSVPGWINTMLGLGGIWVVLVGLVGFYSRVAESAPRLAFAGGATSAIAWIALTVGLGWGIVLDLTTQRTIAEGPPLGGQIFVSAIVLTLLSFLLYGVASGRTRTPSRTVGLALLVPFLAFLVLLALFFGNNVYGFQPPDGVIRALFGLAALGMIAVGYTEWKLPRRPAEG